MSIGKKLRKYVSLILSFVIILGVVNDVYAGEDTVSVRVDWDEVVSETSNKSFGLNAFQIWNEEVSTSEVYHRNSEYMNTGFYRLHSWEMMGDISSKNGWIDNDNQTWGQDKILGAMEGLEDMDADMLMSIPAWPDWMDLDGDKFLDEGQVDAYASFCAELVRIINIEGGYNVKYWEPTNERDDLYYVHFANNGEEDRLDELIDIYIKAAKAMKAVDPSIQVGGLAFARGDLYPQVERFVQAVKDESNPVVLDYLSYHFYSSGDPYGTYQAFYDRVNNNSGENSLAMHTKDIREILDREITDRHVPMFLNEFNIYWSWDINPPAMHTHQAGVFDALALIYGHNNGADGINAWNDMDGAYGKMSSEYELRDPAHVYQMFNNYLVGDVVKVTSSDESKIVAFAVTDNDVTSFVAVNRTDEALALGTSFDGQAFGQEMIALHQTSEAGYHIYSSSWEDLLNNEVYLPANSVTLWTNSETVPTIIPEGIQEVEVEELPALTMDLSVNVPSNHLTFEGNKGWIHLGTAGDTSLVNRKENGERNIDFQVIGDDELLSKYFWIPLDYLDGDIIEQVDGDGYGIGISTPGNGFTFDVPVSANSEFVTLRWGADHASATITATLNDGSGAVVEESIDTSTAWENNYQTTSRFYVNASEDTTLSISLNLDSTTSGEGDLKVQSVTVGDDSPSSSMVRVEESGLEGTTDLSEVGTLDWVFYGGEGMVDSLPSTERKLTDSPMISDLSLVGNPVINTDYTKDLAGERKFSWSDGTTLASAVEASNKVAFHEKGHGFAFQVPASSEAMELSVYGGAMGGASLLEVSLVDSEGRLLTMPYAVEIRNSGWTKNVVERVQFQSDVPGAVLKVQYTFNHNDWGNAVWLSAAALAEADMMPPSQPTELFVEAYDDNSAVLSWNPSLDNLGVDRYEIFSGSQKVGQVDGAINSYFVQGLLPDTSYEMKVVAVDTSGNVSVGSDTVNIVTMTDNVSPTKAHGLQVIPHNEANLYKLSWLPAFDDVGISGYRVYKDGAVIYEGQDLETVFNHTDEAYRLDLVAFDNAGNNSDPVSYTPPMGLSIAPLGSLERDGYLKASVQVSLSEMGYDHEGNEIVIFQLYKNNKPLDMVALEKDLVDGDEVSAMFMVKQPKLDSYYVKVMVVDEVDLDDVLPTLILEPIEIH